MTYIQEGGGGFEILEAPYKRAFFVLTKKLFFETLGSKALVRPF